MQGLLETLQKWHLHPAVDHFTVALLIVAVLADLCASLFSTRMWLRYAALALMILGTAAIWGSNVTGGWEAGRVWKAVQDAGGPAYDTLHRHGEIGDYLPWVFLVLAVWRIGVQLFGFIAGTRGLYLLFAVLAAVAVSYQGYLGGKLVYEYGIGTAIYGAGSSSQTAPSPEATGPATPIPTVYVPAAAATPEATSPTAAVSAEATAVAIPSTSASAAASPSETPTPAPQPSASPAAASGH